jgi:magnesium transporter
MSGPQELSKACGDGGIAGVPRAASAHALASAPPPAARPSTTAAAAATVTHAHAAAAAGGGDDGLAALGDRDLPFEFRVLEKALEDVCGALESNVTELEGETHSALEQLTSKVSSANLERVKRVKVRMTRVTGRVASVRGEIQRFLDDDSDMRDMYLSRKAAAIDEMGMGGGGMGGGDGGGGMGGGMGGGGMSVHGGGRAGEWGHALIDPMDDDADIQQLEDLLENYFAQIDHAFNKMKALDEFVGSTEDYINIDLDSHRNQLIQIDLLLSFGMFITSLFTLITGVFGMNLNSGLQEDPHVFDEVTGISTALVVVGFAIFVYICRQQRLIQIF